MVKLFAFDIFGTLLNMAGVPKDELPYGDHIREPEWSPLVLPETWKTLPPFPDVFIGLHDIRARHGITLTLSNAPIQFQIALWENNYYEGRNIDYFVPLEMLRVYKPNIAAYRSLIWLFPDIQPMCMVISATSKRLSHSACNRS